jgi:hypothetical protein
MGRKDLSFVACSYCKQTFIFHLSNMQLMQTDLVANFSKLVTLHQQEPEKWHRRFGHLGYKKVSKIQTPKKRQIKGFKNFAMLKSKFCAFL